MTDVELLALAGLLYDLKALFGETKTPVSPPVEQLFKKTELGGSLQSILSRAIAQTTPAGASAGQVFGKPLVSVFSKVQLKDQTSSHDWYHKFSPLFSTQKPQEYLFPSSTYDPSGWSKYLVDFEAELKWLSERVDLNRFDALYTHLLAFLQRYAWCIPIYQQDIALLDHSKLVSATAVCLYQQTVTESAPNDEPLCLIVGDLSGIQEYIFDITNIGAGGVARRLRARSFYITAISDVVSHLVAFRFGVPLGNILMASGGKFYVLVANTGAMENRLHKLREEVDEWFREQFNGEIMVNLAQICFSESNLLAKRNDQTGFGSVLTQLNQQLNRQKRQRGQGILTETVDQGEASKKKWKVQAFWIERDFWGHGICPSCKKFPGDQDQGLCAQCVRDVELGKVLPRTEYVAYYQPGKGGIEPNTQTMPSGYTVRALTGKELHKANDAYLVVKLNDPEIHELAAFPAGFRYLANHIPTKEHGIPVTFEEIAAQAQGRSLLGYLKADVDYLGILFAQGLRRDRGGFDTAMHLGSLSRELDLFFSGWMQHVLSNETAFQNFYTVFSGGDDLFLVGPWDQAAQLAMKIHDQFSEFTGKNREVTLSAGIIFTKDSYPISRAAKDVEDVLEEAKEHTWRDAQGGLHNRNQLAILGDTLSWDIAPTIFAEIKMLSEHSQALKSAFLYNLIEYWSMYMLWREKKKIEALRYRPLFAYDIARNLRKGDPVLYHWADDLIQSLHGSQEKPTMRHLGLIATYILFGRRKSSGRGKENG